MSTRLRFLAAVLLAVFVLYAGTVSSHADRRVALVIGNSAYQHVAALPNPRNDAADMAEKLAGLGFEVVLGEDLDFNGMRQKAREFTGKLEGADIALFYYAGHGLQVNGNNYMAPVDARLASHNDLDYEAMPMGLVLSAMERNTKTSLIFLDACRDNPLAVNLARSMGTRSGSVGRGLAKTEGGVGSLIAFATQPGNVALDGTGRNSPFTSALLKHLGTPGQGVTDDLILVRREVLEATAGKQVPWDNSALTGKVVLMEASKVEAAPEAEAPEAAKPDNAVELAYWDSIKDAGNAAYFETYVKRWPQGLFVDIARLKIDELRQRQDDQARTAQEKSAAEAKAAAELEAKREAEAKAAAEREKQIQEQIARLEAARKALEAEEAKRSTAEAQTEVAALDPGKSSAPEAPQLAGAELARAVQGELARIGCLGGKIDGEWGKGSERALKDYAGRQGIALASLQPDNSVLGRLKATTVRVCPLVCGKGLEERAGKCERVKREASVPKEQVREQPAAPDDGAQRKVESDRECYVCPQSGSLKMRVCVRKGSPLNAIHPEPRTCQRLN